MLYADNIALMTESKDDLQLQLSSFLILRKWRPKDKVKNPKFLFFLKEDTINQNFYYNKRNSKIPKFSLKHILFAR